MADDELDDEQREWLEKDRAKKAKAVKAAEDEEQVELGFPEGDYFRGSWARARSVAAARGYKLERVPEDEPQEDDAPAKQSASPAKRVFGVAR